MRHSWVLFRAAGDGRARAAINFRQRRGQPERVAANLCAAFVGFILARPADCHLHKTCGHRGENHDREASQHAAALASGEDHILSDADSHACIYDACRLTDAATHRFRHNDPDNLARRLKRLPETGGRLVVVEGMYSMFGDVAPLAEMVEVAHAHDAMIFVDEAHSVGCFGENGRGIAEAQGVLQDVDFISGTFSKSLASIGGFCVSKHPEFESVRLSSRAYMFTASGAPANIAAARSALRELQAMPQLRDSLWAMSNRLHGGLAEMGYELCAPASPVIAVRRPDEATGFCCA